MPHVTEVSDRSNSASATLERFSPTFCCPTAILDELRGRDRRSIGRSNQVVTIVRRKPALFPALIDGMHHDDELVRMRAADAVEKLTVTNPEWLPPFTAQLMKLAAGATQQELRWHPAQLLPRLELSEKNRKLVAAIRGYREEKVGL